ncbi:hypothetical protein Pla22_16070 [Rubripirellula amarantea]|uniref:Uncharacterized protein n=1 Tax=Rubripirellula amarantea TaxID=2527999 RepID=A0A5C5WVB2_9BACT|nr:hypothetical protein [Rubripirellula amarantea]TWT53973.1 hypothetical protein Pla22_16070 [Rubripirellula amarantea]
MKIKFALAALLVVSTSGVYAATTQNQKFTVNVPAAISITAPTNVSITHDETELDQAFPVQEWVVKGNSLDGVTASFSTASAFVHTTDASAKRDAALGLAVTSSVGGANWNVTTAADSTDYVNNDPVATVQVTSDGFGFANMGLTVSFITDGFGSFPAGAYETTVTGTVTGN